jgi:mono/diheme cytochrome c family protein
MIGGILGLVFILLVLGLMWQAGSSGELASPEVLAQGETIYRENCVACHGPTGEGNVGPALNGSAHTWHHADPQLLSFIRDGIPGTQMAAQRDNFSEEEINAVISYIKSWWMPQQRQMQQAGRH